MGVHKTRQKGRHETSKSVQSRAATFGDLTRRSSNRIETIMHTLTEGALISVADHGVQEDRLPYNASVSYGSNTSASVIACMLLPPGDQSVGQRARESRAADRCRL